jgi:hypothetical protein
MSRPAPALDVDPAVDTHPFWQALRKARIVDGEPPEIERLGVEEALADGRWVDGATVSAEIAARRDEE